MPHVRVRATMAPEKFAESTDKQTLISQDAPPELQVAPVSGSGGGAQTS